ncbi:MAG: hypothetical protein ACFCD0_15280 [Gemmataceae bacterium]
MRKPVTIYLGVGLWFVCLFGALSLTLIPGDYSDYVGVLCGPWGCLPPIQPLIAYHSFWLVVLAFPTGWVLLNLSPSTVALVGKIAFGMSWLGLFLFLGVESYRWLLQVGPTYRMYLGQKLLHSLATHGDLPFVQLLITSFVCWRVGARQKQPRQEMTKEMSSEAIST